MIAKITDPGSTIVFTPQGDRDIWQLGRASRATPCQYVFVNNNLTRVEFKIEDVITQLGGAEDCKTINQPVET